MSDSLKQKCRVRVKIEHLIFRSHLSRLKLQIFLTVGFLLLAASGALAANFTASLDHDTITLGETATLSLKFEDGTPENLPTPAAVAGLQMNYANQITFNSDLNGNKNSTLTVTYAVTPQRTGDFVIPAMTADLNGQRFSSQPLKLTVAQPNAPPADAVNSGNEIAFMKLSLPQKKIYDGQVLTAQLQIYLRDDVQNFGNLQVTGMPADGFVIGKNAEGGRSRVQIGNRVYTIVPLTLALTATKTGTLTLGPFTASMVVVLPSQNNGGDPFMAQFFNQGQQKQISLATEMASAEAAPLPEENKPVNFNGAVGDFTMAASAGPTNVTAGDPVTVRVQISGRGALDAIQLPDQSELRDFKIFPPTSKVENSDQLGLEGTKTFEEIVTPQNSDVRAWPQFSFSFFNPDDGKYHTLTQSAVPLAVHSAGATVMPTIAANNNSANENQSTPDILPIKENLGTLAKNSAPLISQPAFLGLQTLPIFAFLAAFVWRKRTDSLAKNPRLRRQRAVAQLVNGGLGDLNRFAAENKSNEFFAMLFRLLQEQLGERLDCPATSITEADVDKRLIYIGASPATLESLRELFQICNQARYAPIQTRQELAIVAAKLKKVVGELQNLKA